ncbi:MAG: AAA family ATPase [Chloroflexi bacterium]|nr:AAA family ATPase [Chloroflexota bacterium]
MELKTYLTILVRRWRIVLLVAFAVTGVFTYGGKNLPPSFQAETRLRVITPLAGSVRDAYHEVYFASRLITTYAQIATSDQIMIELREDLGVQTLPEISVKVIPESEIIQIVVVSPDRNLSAEAANRLAELIISKQDKVLDSSPASGAMDVLVDRQKELQAEITEASVEHEKLVRTYSQITAQIQTLSRKLQTMEALYLDLVNHQRQTEADALAVEIADLSQQYEKLSAESSVYLEQVLMLRQKIDSDQRVYSDLVYSNVRPQRTRDLIVISPAVVPSVPNSPGILFFVGLGIVCGLIVGVVFAFVFDSLDTRVFAIEQIGHLTNMPVLGVFPKIREGKNQNRSDFPNIEKATLYKDYWMVCTRIQAVLQNKSIRTVLVTSTNPMEGKSTFVSSVAMGLARNNCKVLIVDADLLRPRLQKIYQASGEQGLSDFLENEDVRLEDIIQKNIQPNVDLLPNLTQSDAKGMFNSSQFTALLQKIKKYDVVLFDSPALLVTPDTYNLAKNVDGVIVLVQWGRTTSGDVQSTCNYLEGVVGPKLLGVVLGQVPSKKEPDYYNRKDTKRWPRFMPRIN